MSFLPHISGKQALRAFQKVGWVFRGQVGSHMVLTKPGVPVNLSIPNHKEVAPGTLRKLIKYAELSVEQFVELL